MLCFLGAQIVATIVCEESAVHIDRFFTLECVIITCVSTIAFEPFVCGAALVVRARTCSRGEIVVPSRALVWFARA